MIKEEEEEEEVSTKGSKRERIPGANNNASSSDWKQGEHCWQKRCVVWLLKLWKIQEISGNW